MNEQENRVFAFGRFRLDAANLLLFEGEEVVTLTPKACATLLALVENRGSLMSKEELMRRVWPEEFVEENNLAQNIHVLRKILDSETEDVKYIETIPKRGYRFTAEVTCLTLRRSSSENENWSTRGRTASFINLRPVVPVIPRTQYAVSTGDVNIAYQVIGEGPIDLVFVMGWVSHLEYFWQEPSFARFLSRLASFSRLILFDKRGTGLSDRVPLNELPTLEQRMTDVQAVMNAVGSERAALLGVSEGGPMCALFAATYPERTTALAMIGTYAKRIRSVDYPWAPTPEEHATLLDEVKKNWGGPVGIKERAPSVASDAQFRDWWATYLRMGASPSAALALTRMNAEIDSRDVLQSIHVPTLVIHRAEDTCLPVGGGRYVASRIPGSTFIELEGKDHLPFVGDQDAILDRIEEFLTGARSERQIDRVLTTLLFLLFEDDSTGSTGQTKTAQFRAQVRRELGFYKGKEIDLNEADLLATFDGPARAIRCARAIADLAVRSGLTVRIGLHTGECDVVGDKIGGVAVRLGKAIAECAPPGGLLISHPMKDLVAGSGIEFEARGTQSFENLPGRWRLFTVRRSK
jgi:pimeloyl-ACP methyl ester carboxylesterase/DNA-binding winged helix-turn-helix (wHTH) protein